MQIDTDVNKKIIDRLVSEWIGTERKVEIPFLIENLPEPKGQKTLDIGCCDSNAAKELKNIGFDSYGIDLRKCISTSFNFVRGDARNMSSLFGDNSFDVCYAISSIEHVGLVKTPYFTDTVLDDSGDKKVVQEMVRVTKPNGIIIITIPYGNGDDHLKRWIIFYDKDRIAMIMPKNLIIDKITYKSRVGGINTLSDSTWIDVDEKTASLGYSIQPKLGGDFIVSVILILGHKGDK